MNQPSEHTQTEQALRESETKYRELFESSRDAIMLLFPPEWKLTACNPATVTLFGAESIEPSRRGPRPLSELVKSEAARLLPILKAASEK